LVKAAADCKEGVNSAIGRSVRLLNEAYFPGRAVVLNEGWKRILGIGELYLRIAGGAGAATGRLAVA
jgi:hypothetical protein